MHYTIRILIPFFYAFAFFFFLDDGWNTYCYAKDLAPKDIASAMLPYVEVLPNPCDVEGTYDAEDEEQF